MLVEGKEAPLLWRNLLTYWGELACLAGAEVGEEKGPKERETQTCSEEGVGSWVMKTSYIRRKPFREKKECHLRGEEKGVPRAREIDILRFFQGKKSGNRTCLRHKKRGTIKKGRLGRKTDLSPASAVRRKKSRSLGGGRSNFTEGR